MRPYSEIVTELRKLDELRRTCAERDRRRWDRITSAMDTLRWMLREQAILKPSELNK